MDANTVIVDKNVIFNVFDGYQIELYIADGPKIKVHRNNNDVTNNIFGLTNIYGSLDNLANVYNVLKGMRSIF